MPFGVRPGLPVVSPVASLLSGRDPGQHVVAQQPESAHGALPPVVQVVHPDQRDGQPAACGGGAQVLGEGALAGPGRTVDADQPGAAESRLIGHDPVDECFVANDLS